MFWSACLCSLQRGVNALGCVRLHPRQHVAVKVERDPDLGMPETFAGHFGMDAVASMWVAWACRRSWNRMRGRDVSCELPNPILRQSVRLQWRSICLRHNERIVR